MNSLKCDSVRRSAYGVALLGALLSAACDNVNEPGISPVGTYGSTTFITTTNGVSTNHLANGSMISITLHPNGTTSGQLQESIRHGPLGNSHTKP